jgi:hypothetical protein
MDRRKFIAAMGSLAAGGAAATGTGAFTSVSANRSLTVQTDGDNDALLGLYAEDGANAETYVSAPGDNGTLSIDITTDVADDNSAAPNDANKNAYTVVRSLFEVKNQGTQNVYVWASGLPDGVRLFHDDPDIMNHVSNSGYSINEGGNDGAFSTTSSIDADDPAGQVDAGDGDGDEAAPLLAPGSGLDDVGMIVDTRGDTTVNFDSTITIKAKAPSEL